MKKVLHITARSAWQEARLKGEYTAPSLAAQGFIHCSTAAQVLEVAGEFYSGQSGLVLLVIDPARLTSELKWEAPSGGTPPGVPAGDPFPHIYGPIALEAVTQVLDFNADAAGQFHLPLGLAD